MKTRVYFTIGIALLFVAFAAVDSILLTPISADLATHQLDDSVEAYQAMRSFDTMRTGLWLGATILLGVSLYATWSKPIALLLKKGKEA